MEGPERSRSSHNQDAVQSEDGWQGSFPSCRTLAKSCSSLSPRGRSTTANVRMSFSRSRAASVRRARPTTSCSSPVGFTSWQEGSAPSLYACFVDLTKAYDSIDRELLLAEILKRSGVPPRMLMVTVKQLVPQWHGGACEDGRWQMS